MKEGCVCVCSDCLSLCVDVKYIVLITKIQMNKNNAVRDNLFIMCMRCAGRLVWCSLAAQALKIYSVVS